MDDGRQPKELKQQQEAKESVKEEKRRALKILRKRQLAGQDTLTGMNSDRKAACCKTQGCKDVEKTTGCICIAELLSYRPCAPVALKSIQ